MFAARDQQFGTIAIPSLVQALSSRENGLERVRLLQRDPVVDDQEQLFRPGFPAWSRV